MSRTIEWFLMASRYLPNLCSEAPTPLPGLCLASWKSSMSGGKLLYDVGAKLGEASSAIVVHAKEYT
ncbi:hypothetical protein ACFX13_026706 [Malus domestica]